MTTNQKTVLYSILAAAVGAALPHVPPPYVDVATSLAAVVLLNLRNAWHVQAEAKALAKGFDLGERSSK
jgi:hypothetical protein